jgi:hypothetical protein
MIGVAWVVLCATVAGSVAQKEASCEFVEYDDLLECPDVCSGYGEIKQLYDSVSAQDSQLVSGYTKLNVSFGGAVCMMMMDDSG